MSGPQQTSAMPRKSFAQVAASAANTTAKSKSRGDPIKSSNPKPGPDNSAHNVYSTQNMIAENDAGITQKQDLAAPKQDAEEIIQINHRLQSVNFTVEDLLSPGDNSDSRSFTSRTTMTLDEKESLRPDDSASIQAAADQDALSTVDEARTSSHPEETAFHDQLRRMNLSGHGDEDINIAIGMESTALKSQSPLSHIQSSNAPLVISPLSNERPATIGGTLHLSPDEKLLEALASPPDRVFVLKIEQDLIDFIKNPREQQFELPQMNGFYRMLSHKLADYYMLGHGLNESMTAVRIFRTPNCRLPPRLIDLRVESAAPTPPSHHQARKILRRERLMQEAQKTGDQSISLDKINSQFSSNAPSESGAGSGGDDPGSQTPNKGNEKSALTLEERESRYKEARARIFGLDSKIESADSPDVSLAEESKEMSRSSSTSGAKKSKKQKKPKDDTFESRSAYSQMNGQAFPNSALVGMSPVGSQAYDPFNSFSGHSQSAFLPQAFVPDQSMQYGGMHMAQSQMPQQQPGWYNASITPGYTEGSHLSRMDWGHNQAFGGAYSPYNPTQQVASDFSSQETPRATFAPISGFPIGSPSHLDAQNWQQGHMYSPYPPSQPYYPGAGANGPMSQGYHVQGSQGLQRVFGPQEPMYHLQTSHGSYDRAQFDPNSQVFVPGGQLGPFQHSLSNPTNTSAYQSSKPMQQHIPTSSHSTPYGASQQQQQHVFNGRVSTSGTQPSNQRSRSGNVPPNSSSQSSISKWGTPSTLPPKPPPPAVQSPYFDLPRDPKNEQPLPQHPFASNRLPSHSTVAAGSAK